MKRFLPERFRFSKFSLNRVIAAARRRIDELQHTIAWCINLSVAVENRDKLRDYYQMYKGERCVIIGNGPSLQQVDFSLITNEVTFGMNRIYLLFEQIAFRPTYYVAVNELVLEQFSRDIDKLDMPKFLNWNRRRLFNLSDSSAAFLKLRFGFCDGFAEDITKPIFGGGTVTYAALQIAYYMGFEEVILVGVDHNFADKGIPNTTEERVEDIDKNHFHPQYFPKGVKWQLPDLRRSELAYKQAHRAFERDGRRILDATIEGKCPAFEKVDFFSIFR